MTTAAPASLRAELYPHGTAALNTIQQLAGAAGGAVLKSAYTTGWNAADAGAPSTSQSIRAGNAALTTAGVLALGADLGTAFVRWYLSGPCRLSRTGQLESAVNSPHARRFWRGVEHIDAVAPQFKGSAHLRLAAQQGSLDSLAEVLGE